MTLELVVTWFLTCCKMLSNIILGFLKWAFVEFGSREGIYVIIQGLYYFPWNFLHMKLGPCRSLPFNCWRTSHTYCTLGRWWRSGWRALALFSSSSSSSFSLMCDWGRSSVSFSQLGQTAVLNGEPFRICAFQVNIHPDPTNLWWNVHEHYPLEYKLLK